MVLTLEDLSHTYVNLPRGGEVIVLDTGALITAEAEAMIQALHSRSSDGLRGHLDILRRRGPDKFMQNFYVGYGHKSIGDCGSTTVFIEGVSMLAAKAIQDSALYSGQEASTRYIDFSTQEMVTPLDRKKGLDILEKQRKFYLQAQDPTRSALVEQHPQGKKEKDQTYEKAINARGFDITRSLLPAGVSTNLAWHTNLRQAADRILFLRHHPLAEVREIAQGLEEALSTHHPNSFGHKRYEATEAYQDLIAAHYLYHDPSTPEEGSVLMDFSKIDQEELALNEKLFRERPEKTELPKYLGQIGTVDARFRIDFGSFRDLQRHRAIIQRMPLLTSTLGFNQWYVNNLPGTVGAQLDAHLQQVVREVEALGCTPEEAQYFLPMGLNTSNRFSGDLPATVYMVELRDSRFVHPTLQVIAHEIGEQITRELGIPLHVDPAPRRFDVKRGEQDIVLK